MCDLELTLKLRKMFMWQVDAGRLDRVRPGVAVPESINAACLRLDMLEGMVIDRVALS